MSRRSYGMTDVEEQATQVLIHDCNGNTIALDMQASDTVGTLKDTISKKKGHPPEQQRLLFEGQQLEDTSTLFDYRINTGSTVEMSVSRTCEGMENVEEQAMQILIKDFAGNNVVLDVQASDTVGSLKETIGKKDGSSPEQQHLVFEGQRLEDDRTLAEYRITCGSTVQMSVPRGSYGMEGVHEQATQILIKDCNGLAIVLDMQQSDTVGALKEMISKKEGHPPQQQRLLFAGQQLEDTRTLSDYGINSGSTVQMSIRIQRGANILVRSMQGKVMVLDVDPSTTVSDLKERIREREGIPPQQQRLVFAGKQLVDGSTLFESNIGRDDTVYLVPRMTKVMHITARTLAGKTMKLVVAPSESVASVKRKIEVLEGVQPDQQRLIFAGKMLEDTKPISEYMIQDNATLHLVIRPGSSHPYSLAVEGSCDAVGACGLVNLGNTCFMNSALQALSNTVPLRRYYSSGDFKADLSTAPLSTKGRLANSFADLLKTMWANTHKVQSPLELKHLIAEKRSEFAGYRQHDAQELLAFLLDGLHEDVNRAPYPRPFVEDPSTEGKIDADIAAEAWSGNLRRNDSKIVDLFQFQVRSEITFPDVGDKSLKFDPMMYLSLPIPKPPHSVNVTDPSCSSSIHAIDLAQCLEAFTSREELAQEDWVKSEKTGEVERTTKKLDLWTAPDCLLIHLKRFTSSEFGGNMQKVETFVQAPIELDLSSWVRAPMPEVGMQYSLYAVVNHTGSLLYGHYTAYGRVGEGQDRQWYHFNDATVTQAEESDVISSSAYILCYERVRPCSTSAASGAEP